MSAHKFIELLAVCLPAGSLSLGLVQPGHGSNSDPFTPIRIFRRKASGKIGVGSSGGANGNNARDCRMHLDILGSGRYPEASFTPVRAAGKLAPRGWSQLDLSGIFKIHGSDRELALHFQGERLGGQHIASAHFAIPYAPWGMKNPRDFLLKVDKTVGIDIQAAGNASS